MENQHPKPTLDNDFNTSVGPWKCRAATFCDDGIPSFEVVMPDGPYMNACDARLISAAPTLLRLLKTTLDHLEGRLVHVSAETPLEDWATERAMTAAHIRDELDAALMPPL